MKKKIIGIALFAIIAVGAVINMNKDKNEIITDLALNNIEALASGEGGWITCYTSSGSWGMCSFSGDIGCNPCWH